MIWNVVPIAVLWSNWLERRRIFDGNNFDFVSFGVWPNSSLLWVARRYSKGGILQQIGLEMRLPQQYLAIELTILIASPSQDEKSSNAGLLTPFNLLSSSPSFFLLRWICFYISIESYGMGSYVVSSWVGERFKPIWSHQQD